MDPMYPIVGNLIERIESKEINVNISQEVMSAQNLIERIESSQGTLHRLLLALCLNLIERIESHIHIHLRLEKAYRRESHREN